MRITKRKALLAAVLTLTATATAVPMVVSGTASAQENARLCGRYWRSVDRGDEKGTGEVVVRIFEVTKGIGGTDPCNILNVETQFPKGPFNLREQGRTSREWESNDFAKVVCESWRTAREPIFGGLGTENLNFKAPGDFPADQNQSDICQNMNRNEDFISSEIYWLYNDPNTEGIDFVRE